MKTIKFLIVLLTLTIFTSCKGSEEYKGQIEELRTEISGLEFSKTILTNSIVQLRSTVTRLDEVISEKRIISVGRTPIYTITYIMHRKQFGSIFKNAANKKKFTLEVSAATYHKSTVGQHIFKMTINKPLELELNPPKYYITVAKKQIR